MCGVSDAKLPLPACKSGKQQKEMYLSFLRDIKKKLAEAVKRKAVEYKYRLVICARIDHNLTAERHH